MQELDRELGDFYRARLPISASRMQSLTKAALRCCSKDYKAVVHAFERQRPPLDYRLPTLYAIDAVCRAAAKERRQRVECDKLLQRFAAKLPAIFSQALLIADGEGASIDRDKVQRVLGIWEKATLFEADLVTELSELVLAPPTVLGATSQQHEEQQHHLSRNEDAATDDVERESRDEATPPVSSSSSAVVASSTNATTSAITNPLAFDYDDSSSDESDNQNSSGAVVNASQKRRLERKESLIPPPIPVSAIAARTTTSSTSTGAANAGSTVTGTPLSAGPDVFVSGIPATDNPSGGLTLLDSLNALKEFAARQPTQLATAALGEDTASGAHMQEHYPENKRPRHG